MGKSEKRIAENVETIKDGSLGLETIAADVSDDGAAKQETRIQETRPKEKEETRQPESMAAAKAEMKAADAGSLSTQDRLIAEQLGKQRKARIRIASGKDAHERCPVPVAVNGREFLIERDKDVDVPEGVLNVLNLANMQVAETSNAGGQTSTSFHAAARFAISFLGYVDENGGIVAP